MADDNKYGIQGAYHKMDVNKAKQAKDIIANAAKDNQELKDEFNDAINELEKLERQMAEIAETLLGKGQVRKEDADFVGSEADNDVMFLMSHNECKDRKKKQ